MSIQAKNELTKNTIFLSMYTHKEKFLLVNLTQPKLNSPSIRAITFYPMWNRYQRVLDDDEIKRFRFLYIFK